MTFTRRHFLLAASTGLLASCQAEQGPVIGALPDVQMDNERLPVPTPIVPPGPPSLPPPTAKPVPAYGVGSFGVYPRSSWTRYGPVVSHIEPMNGVTRITFHHSGDQHNGRDVPFLADGFAETVAHLELVRQYHVNQRGWADIGYHFAIDRAGRVYQLRSLRYQGAHVKGQDEHNLGIVVLGNFHVQDPTAAQKARILSFGKLSRTEYAVAPKRVFTHREIGQSTCPGDRMQAYMVDVRHRNLI